MTSHTNPTQRLQHHTWTDGAAKGNPGPAAYAVHDNIHSIGIPMGNSTNNLAEFMAIVVATRISPNDCDLYIHTDSKVAIAWIRGRGNPIQAVRDYANEWKDEIIRRNIIPHFVIVKGHSGEPGNTIADRLAQDAAETQRLTGFS